MIRAPIEVMKQHAQVGQSAAGLVAREGLPALYRGFFVMIIREIPFACVQFPLYERFKVRSYLVY